MKSITARVVILVKYVGLALADHKFTHKPKICYNGKNIKELKYGLFAFGRKRLPNC